MDRRFITILFGLLEAFFFYPKFLRNAKKQRAKRLEGIATMTMMAVSVTVEKGAVVETDEYDDDADDGDDGDEDDDDDDGDVCWQRRR